MGDLTEAIYGLWARSFQLFYCLVKPLRRAGLFQGSLCLTSVSPHPSLTPAIPLSQFTRKTVKVTAVLHTKRGTEATSVAGKACYQVEASPTPSPSLFPAAAVGWNWTKRLQFKRLVIELEVAICASRHRLPR